MELPEVLGRPAEIAQVRRVFGEPIERDGVTLVPTASVRGGAGGGGGRGRSPKQDEGEGEAYAKLQAHIDQRKKKPA